MGYSPWGCKSHDLVTEPPAGGEVEAVTDFIFLGSQITADGDYSHELRDTCSLEEKL